MNTMLANLLKCLLLQVGKCQLLMEVLLRKISIPAQVLPFFDVSHMGEIQVGGKDALSFLNYVFTNEISACKVGEAIYSSLFREWGNS